MINKSQIKKMWVWNGDRSNPKDLKRYVLYQTPNQYLCVTANTEYFFEKGQSNFDLTAYDNCEEIKEEWRPFKAGEMPIEYMNYLYRNKEDGVIYRSSMYAPTGNPVLYLDDCWVTNSELFEDWEVLIDGKWQPVGVKIED